MKVSKVMTRRVYTVRADTTVQEIADLLTTQRISAVPVVDDQERVIGMVTEDDLFLKPKGIPFSAVKVPALFKEWVDPLQLAEIYKSARYHTAADVMTRDVMCVDADDHVGHVAWLMCQHKLKSVPVVRAGKLVGIITRADVIRMLAKKDG